MLTDSHKNKILKLFAVVASQRGMSKGCKYNTPNRPTHLNSFIKIYIKFMK